MNCIKCYQEIPDGAKFCPYCGAQQSDTSATDPVRAEETQCKICRRNIDFRAFVRNRKKYSGISV